MKKAKILFKPPKQARLNAKKFLQYWREHGRQRCNITRIGLLRAKQLSSGKKISLSTVKRMAQFNRHRKNSKVKNGLKPWQDCGHRAWLAWGGNAGVDWAIKTLKRLR